MNNIRAVKMRQFTHLDKLSTRTLEACRDEIVQELEELGVYKEIQKAARKRSGLEAIEKELFNREQ